MFFHHNRYGQETSKPSLVCGRDSIRHDIFGHDSHRVQHLVSRVPTSIGLDRRWIDRTIIGRMVRVRLVE